MPIFMSLFGDVNEGAVSMLIPIVTMVMVLLIPIVSIIMDGFTKRSRMKVLEEALRQGVPVEDLPLNESTERLPYRSGMVCVAVGLGIALFGICISIAMEQTGEPDYIAPRMIMPAIGLIIILIGAALLANDYLHRDRLSSSNHDGNRLR
ncbi:MAG: hypothetical protein GY835_26520 [bacterium]|nr:hypothetical protein [bacterium]